MQQTTFWEFLNNHNIEIPIIQRDYAQGRRGKERLREKFLHDLKNAIDDKLDNDEKTLKLDFIYGSIDSNNLNPLDGQQRLTTLWLLHWYIAHKAGKLEENKSVFRRFSYETRVSSHDFCEKLSNFSAQSDEKIIPYIQNQRWFLSVWKQDPTIQAMLNMLGGTPGKDNEGKEIIDGIEELFSSCKKVDFTNYWEKITANNCPIIFYYLDLQGLTLSDDLYIKMNARGKPLTSFENFKADLVGYISKKEENNERQKGKTPQDSIAHKLDVDWTNIFWKNRSPEQKIDEIYFAFINRFLLNSLATAKDSNENYKYTQEGVDKEDLFKHIYGGGAREYNNFNVYNKEEDFFCESIDRLEKTLDNFHKSFRSIPNESFINTLFFPSWSDDSSFYFIPRYIDDEKEKGKYKTNPITQPQRVVFYAICCYFEQGEYEEKSLKQWMRVVWNIVENGNVNSNTSMAGTMRLIDKLAEYSHDIYNHLKDRDISNDFAKEQMEEEKEKAQIIIKNEKFTEGTEKRDWENKIIEAERQTFFKGNIAYLLKACESNFERFVQILDLCIDRIKVDNIELLKNYLTYIDRDTLPLSCDISSYNNWKIILTGKRSERSTLEFFRSNLAPKPNEGSWKDWKEVLICDFDEINPLRCTIQNYYTNEWLEYTENDVFVYVNTNISAAKLLSSKRKTILCKLKEKNIIQSEFSLYPNTNDRGQLWINQDWFTEDFKLQFSSHINQVRIFLDKDNAYIKYGMENSGNKEKLI